MTDAKPSNQMYPWRDKATMERMYVDEIMSMVEIAEELGCSQSTVSTWLNKHDIEIRSHSLSMLLRDPFPGVNLTTNNQGYENWYRTEGTVSVHRLLAVAKFGFDAVCGMDVHHKNTVKWDNRHENIELMDPSEHLTHHKTKIRGLDRLRIAEFYEHGDISSRDLGDLFDISGSTVLNIHAEGYGA